MRANPNAAQKREPKLEDRLETLVVASPLPLRPRIDLRTGLVAAGALDAPESLSKLVRTLRDARYAWRAAGFTAPLSFALPHELLTTDAEWICDAAREAGCSPRNLTFELDERALVRAGQFVAEALRARGWGVALIADEDCPMPFGARARALYTELVLRAPNPLDPYLATDPRELSPLGRRLYAAKEAGLIITAHEVKSEAHAALLALAGFDRAGGAIAAQM